MWYLAEILFAQPQQDKRRMSVCESCNVLFHANCAEAAYSKALDWGHRYIANSSAIELLGISHLTSIDGEIGDGVEVCGRYFKKLDVWQNKDRLIPPPEQLQAIQWESRRSTPIQELIQPSQLENLKKLFGDRS